MLSFAGPACGGHWQGGSGEPRSRRVSAALRGRPRPHSKAPRRQGGSFSRDGSYRQESDPLRLSRGEKETQT